MAIQQNLEATSTRPYLVRALHEWCCDNGFTPYITVAVDASVQVPREYVNNDEVVLNISFDATTSLRMSNDYVEFKARFSGAVRDIIVPMDHIIAIFSRESGQGMAFPKPEGPTQKLAAVKNPPRSAVSLAKVAMPAGDTESSAEENQLTTAEESVNVSASHETPLLSQKKKPSLTRVK